MRGTSGDIAKLQASSMTYYIGMQNEAGKTNKFDVKEQTIYWNPNKAYQTKTGIWLSPATILAHEAGHAAQFDADPEQFIIDSFVKGNEQYGSEEERRNITTTEQDAARKHKEITENMVTRTNHRIFDMRDVSNLTPYEIETENEQLNDPFKH